MDNFRSKKFLELCRGQQCFLEIINVCHGDGDTVVPCHSPDLDRIHGSEGINVKASDSQTVPGCRHCHDVIDGRSSRKMPKDERQYWFNRGHALWINHLLYSGKLEITQVEI